MALVKFTIADAISGKIGGLVFSHNAGGAYIRALAIPTNPNTPQQVVVRNAVALLTSVWSGELTQAQRDSWDLYAANVGITNRIGEQQNVSGLAMYIRSNVGQIQMNQARNDDGPPVFNLGAFTAPAMVNASVATQTVDITFRNDLISDEWANETGGTLGIFLSRPQNVGINFFINPYRFAGFVPGDPIPPTSPATITVPFAIALGQRLFGRFVAQRADGRLATPSRATVLTVA